MEYSITSKRIGEIAEVNQGHIFRKGISNRPEGNVFLIQPSDVDEGKKVDSSKLHRVRRGDIKDHSLIGGDDVIIRSKTSNPISFIISDTEKDYAVTNHFMIIRLRDESILPEYLVWFLNSPSALSFFSEMMVGTTVSFLKKKDLISLEVPVPPLNVQKRIIKIDKLIRKEESLMYELINTKKSLVHKVLKDKARGV